MKSVLIALICFLTSTIVFSQKSIKGTWQPEGKDAIFKIFEEDVKFYGQLIGSDNPDEDKKIKEQDKIILLRNLEKTTNTEYCCGFFISPKNKKKATARLTVKDENTIVIKVKKGWFSKSIIWKRIYK